MKKLAILFALTACVRPDVTCDYSISGVTNGADIKICASQKHAGAIYSLVWNGHEFINHTDFGRELQSAVTYDGLGEAYNPTEAGARRDWDTSTSQLLHADTSGALSTETRMAYWDPLPTATLSNDILQKRVLIRPDHIEYMTTFNVSAPYSQAQFEAVTGYLGAEFSSQYVLGADGTLAPRTQLVNERPLILATPDGNYAMGAYSQGAANYGYSFTDTNKWSLVFWASNIERAAYRFVTKIFVGTLMQVVATMKGNL
jgi:hypothetical protein